ncbi:hypothetical protein P3T76_003026 [Phytophthora citrophthora]|uniref:Uncharacterized protein n=1 Tax=Phytophthora citrophthora TaxID=4793 RepID=A0AAD9GXP7_9STRA|nr:hypothetical protein P3T76_003026 [Phytophthora citrophthora]
MTYTNPKPWTCLKFSTCSYWHRTESAYWYKLGSKQYGMFYESDKCVAGGLYHYLTDLDSPQGGAKLLMKPQPIQSMMVGVTSDEYREPNITYVDNCPSEEKLQLLPESNVLITYNTSGELDGSASLSSNWNVDLP